MINGTYRKKRRNIFLGIGCLTLPASIFLFLVFLIIFLVWMANSPEWQARLYGSQTQGVIKSVADDCNATPTDPSLDPSLNGGFVLGSFLPQVQIEQNVLPTVEFTDSQGHRYDIRENYCGDYGVGEQVTVWYLPANPTTFALAQETNATLLDVYIPLIGILISLLFMLGSGAVLIVGAVRRKRAASRENDPFAGAFEETGSGSRAMSAFPWEKR